MKQRTEDILAYLFIGSVVAAVLFGIFAGITVRISGDHEDGYSVGTLINVRQEGVLWPRPAANLLHTGEMKGDEYGMDEGLFEQAVELADRSARVRITYANRYVCWAWNYSSCNIITHLEEMPTGTHHVEATKP